MEKRRKKGRAERTRRKARGKKKVGRGRNRLVWHCQPFSSTKESGGIYLETLVSNLFPLCYQIALAIIQIPSMCSGKKNAILVHT